MEEGQKEVRRHYLFAVWTAGTHAYAVLFVHLFIYLFFKFIIQFPNMCTQISWSVKWNEMALRWTPPWGYRDGHRDGERRATHGCFGKEINGAFFVFIMWFNDAIPLIKRTFFNIYTFIYTFPPSQTGTQWATTNISVLSSTQSAAGLFYCVVMDDFSLAFFNTVQHSNTSHPPSFIWVHKERPSYIRKAYI